MTFEYIYIYCNENQCRGVHNSLSYILIFVMNERHSVTNIKIYESIVSLFLFAQASIIYEILSLLYHHYNYIKHPVHVSNIHWPSLWTVNSQNVSSRGLPKLTHNEEMFYEIYSIKHY